MPPNSGVGRKFARIALPILLFAIAFYRFSDNSSSVASDPHRLVTSSLRSPSSLANNRDNGECRFYLAESAIPHSGLGLFTAIDIQEGEQAQSMPDICIYVADTPKGTHFQTHSWARDVWFGSFEGRNPRAACEGFATLFNSMPPGVQTSKLAMLQSHDNAGLERRKDPNAGAISQYYGVTSMATRDISAGSELTIDYGDWHYKKGQKYTAPVRTVPWLQKHGMCIDHIRIRQATDKSHGRGAFAAHSLKRGQRVSPVPLQLFADQSVFEQQQPAAQFVNYCISVPGTSLLLFPYGPGVNMVNHASDPKKVNVKFEWSSHPMHHAAWLQLPLSQTLQMDYPGGLLLDLVATRDISEGEELYMDYGAGWQQAWEKHVQSWKPVGGAEDYRYPAQIDRSQPIRTISEQEKDPYPSNLATVCWTENWKRDAYSTMKWKKPEGFDWPEGLAFCNIHKRHKNAKTGEYEYEVSLNFDESSPDREDKRKYIDEGVPHSAIYFVDRPYESDLHLPNGFRHPIELPADIVPEEWVKNNQS